MPVTINGVLVEFPHPNPYSVQTVYMQKVIDCLKNSSNGVLESPTGTGKTLSLLCSTLAWKQGLRRESEMQSDEVPPDIEPKIFYASRTHTQLTQVIKELKGTNYTNMKMAVLGSRDQYCVHPDLINESGDAKNRKCKSKIKKQNSNGQGGCDCTFYNGFQEGLSILLNDVGSKILDIEDLVTEGGKKNFCPYYLSRELAKQADILFLPYNYLLDPKIRSSLDEIRLNDAVIILDEAHNVSQICEKAASVEFKGTDIQSAIEDVQFLVDLDYSLLACIEDVRKFDNKDLICLRAILERLKKAIDDIELKHQLSVKEDNGQFIYKLMDKAGIYRETHTKPALSIIFSKTGNIKWYVSSETMTNLYAIDFDNAKNIAILTSNVLKYLSAFADTFETEHRGSGLKFFNDALWTVFSGGRENFRQDVEKHYRVYIEYEKLFTPQTVRNKLINFWCFSPKFGLDYLLRRKHVRCIIFTSGTMSPIKPFSKCLGIPISVTLQNRHIIDQSQVYVRIISNGNDKELLTSKYDNRNNPKYVQSLGSTILALCAVIPDGMLIFFPSYTLLDECKDSWVKSGIWSQIDRAKKIHVEPKSKVEFKEAMTRYYEKINDSSAKGAIFMGVCRGKVSEGLDFADAKGRAVLIIGLPNLPFDDPKVKSKRAYMDDCCMSDNKFQCDGDEWYRLEASRAVNQAIGRVIRHQNDFGAILLLDSRFNDSMRKTDLSLWVQGHLRKSAETFGHVITSLSKFFKDQRLVPVQGERNREVAIQNEEHLDELIGEQENINVNPASTDSPMTVCNKRLSSLLEPSPLPKSSENIVISPQRKRKCCTNLALNFDQSNK